MENKHPEPCGTCKFFNEEDIICDLQLNTGRAILTGKCKKKEEIDISDTK